jgi:small conductance mechanosensitive channel
MNMETQIKEAYDAIIEILATYGLDVVGAIVILIVGMIVAGWAQRTTRRALSKIDRLDETLRGFFASIVKYVIVIFVILAVLNQFGVQTTSLIALLGAAGLAIGLALQGTLSNIAAGLMLLWLRPFNVGDYVETGSAAGTVREVGLFATHLDSYDGNYRFVPNSELWNTALTNYSRNPTRMTDLAIGIGYGSDIEKARQVLLDLAASDTRVVNNPAPLVFVDNLGDSAVVLRYRVWIGNADYWAAQRYLIEESKRRLDAAGIDIPFPQRVVHMIGAEAEAA